MRSDTERDNPYLRNSGRMQAKDIRDSDNGSLFDLTEEQGSMTGKGRVICTWLCAGLVTICIAGCGASADNAKTGENASADENVIADGNMNTEADMEADESGLSDGGADADDGADTGEETVSADVPDFEGLGLSILGDSISTFDGWIPEGCSVFYPLHGNVTNVSQTWWKRLIDDTGMELCSNGSSSGSTCVGDSMCIDDPKYGCSGYRISLLAGQQGRMPDVIIIYMGTNDLLSDIPLGDNDGTGLVEEGMIGNFSDAYTLILDKLESDYPIAQIYCCTLAMVGDWGTDRPFVPFVNRLGLTSEDYSKQIQLIAENRGITVIDLLNCGIEIDNMDVLTLDGVHFTPEGMEYVERAVLSGMGVTPGE